jgi:hypothetical protein
MYAMRPWGEVEFEGIKTHMNLTRTYEATRRAEMQLL